METAKSHTLRTETKRHILYSEAAVLMAGSAALALIEFQDDKIDVLSGGLLALSSAAAVTEIAMAYSRHREANAIEQEEKETPPSRKERLLTRANNIKARGVIWGSVAIGSAVANYSGHMEPGVSDDTYIGIAVVGGVLAMRDMFKAELLRSEAEVLPDDSDS